MSAGGRRAWRLLAAGWLAGAVVVWNVVFDGFILRGAHGYVERQQLAADGRGPRVDVDQAMGEAKAAGLRAAWAWTGAELAPGVALAAFLRFRRRRVPGGRSRASR